MMTTKQSAEGEQKSLRTLAESALFPLAPVTVISGHYGVGKTNFAINLALQAAELGYNTTLADFDVVNPYFRSSDSRALLEEAGIRLSAPVLAGTTLEGPSVTGEIAVVAKQARESFAAAAVDDGLSKQVLIVDAGGDDAGSTALGRFSQDIVEGEYCMLYVVNQRREINAEEAVRILREIEGASHLIAQGLVNNTHLMADTTDEIIEQGMHFAQEVASLSGLPLLCSTLPCSTMWEVLDRKTTRFDENGGEQMLCGVQVYVRTPWQ